MKDLATKEKILEVANILFSKSGYGGTSIRDIANEAKVNVSAVNYYFKNKNGLYCEIFRSNYEKISKKVEEIYKSEEGSFSDFSLNVYNYFKVNGHSVTNTFKIFINDDVCLDEVNIIKDNDSFGPPGQDYFLSKLTEEIGESVPLEIRSWGMRIIFTHILHHAVCMNASVIKKKAKDIPFLSEEAQNQTIRNLVFSITQYIVNKDNWKNFNF